MDQKTKYILWAIIITLVVLATVGTVMGFTVFVPDDTQPVVSDVCPSTMYEVDSRCMSCTATQRCMTDGMTCHIATSTCIPSCLSSSNCATGYVCDPGYRGCVQCVTSSDCGSSGSGPICDTTTNVCRAASSAIVSSQCVNNNECRKPFTVCASTRDAGFQCTSIVSSPLLYLSMEGQNVCVEDGRLILSLTKLPASFGQVGPHTPLRVQERGVPHPCMIRGDGRLDCTQWRAGNDDDDNYPAFASQTGILLTTEGVLHEGALVQLRLDESTLLSRSGSSLVPVSAAGAESESTLFRART